MEAGTPGVKSNRTRQTQYGVERAPQLNLFAVGFPAALTAGLAMLSLALPF